MELVIIPNIENEDEKQRAIDELPISGEGKTITTMEPKFVPNKGIAINVEGISINARLVDCVGYVIKDAKAFLYLNSLKNFIKPISPLCFPRLS